MFKNFIKKFWENVLNFCANFILILKIFTVIFCWMSPQTEILAMPLRVGVISC